MFASSEDHSEEDTQHSHTFPFSVIRGVVDGSYRDLIDGSEEVKQQLLKTVKDLCSQGVSLIVGDCGLMILYQKEIAQASNVPVITSSLVLLPIISKIISPDKSIGIITGHSKLLQPHHIQSDSLDQGVLLVIQGMEDEAHFSEVVIQRQAETNVYLMERDVFSAVDKLLAKENNIGAILLECSNLCPFAYAVTKKYKFPIFSINTAIEFIHQSICPAH